MKTVSTFASIAAVLCAVASADGELQFVSEEEPPGIVAETEQNNSVPPPKNAAQVLNNTLSRFPSEPVSIGGTLILRKQRGIVVREIPFKITLNWGATPASAFYELYDGFGRLTRTLRLERTSNGVSTLAFADGEGSPLPSPNLTDSIENTDITWLDITFSFLWWKDLHLEGEEEFRGALCDIVVAKPPHPIPGCAAVKLWVDRKRGFLRQAEQINEDGVPVRWMWVSSVGKIDDKWMIRNMEIKRPKTGLRTKLHVETLETTTL